MERPTIVHKNLVYKRSKFFAAACNGNWSEAAQQVIKLPEVPVICFHIYLEKLYDPTASLIYLCEGVVRHAFPTNGKPLDPTTRKLGTTYLLCSLWRTADYLQDHTFQNLVIDVLCWAPGQMALNPDIMKWLLGHVDLGSGLPRWALHFLAAMLNEEVMDTLREMPQDFMFALLKRRVALGKKLALTASKDRCEYHVNPEGEARCT